MTDIAIRVENLSKQYRIGGPQARYKTIRESLTEAVGAPFRRLSSVVRGQSSAVSNETIWALKDVSFEVQRGEVVGIIGRNGAGKTTLLKILSRITEPTEGQAEIHGRVGSLLEVGTGFHPELTGRENIYLNGAILGMKRAEIDRKFDEMVAFAEIEKFMDTPVKYYSSGMYVRLAFAVAAHLEPEILLVDEVLAVGDAAFQRKCLGKMGDVAREGRTVLFVSHNMGAIRSLCQRAILLHEGEIASNGVVGKVVDQYLSMAGIDEAMQGEVTWLADDAPGSDHIRCDAIRLVNEQGEISTTFRVDEELTVELEYTVLKPLRGFRFKLIFVTTQGEVAFCTTDHTQRRDDLTLGEYMARCTIPPDLFNQRRYTVGIGGGIPGIRSHIRPVSAVAFQVLGSSRGSYYPDRNWPGVLAPKTKWQIDFKRG